MEKRSLTLLTTAIFSGLLATQGLPARAQVQVDVSAPTPPPVTVVDPAASVQVYVAPPAPATVVHVQSGEYHGGGTRAGGRLMVSGAAMFGVTYLITVLGSAIASDVCQADSSLGCRQAGWPIYLPIIGPFIQMGFLSGSGANTGRAILAIDGVVQAGGVAMSIAGAVLWGSHTSHSQYAKRLQVVPYSGSTGTGLVALGRF